MRLLIILVDYSFSERDYKRFSISYLQQHFDVKVVDLSGWMKRKVAHLEVSYPFDGHYQITHWKGCKNFIKLIPKSGYLVIDCLSNNIKSVWLRRKLYFLGARFIILRLGLLPTYKTQFSIKLYFKTLLSPQKYLRFIYHSFLRHLMPRINIAMIGGRVALSMLKAIPHKIFAHSFDYDVYLNKQYSFNNLNVTYAVFLDEDMINHPDYIYCDLPCPATAKEYYTSLATFFDYLEEKFKLKIIIATHPRSKLDDKDTPFNGRLCIQGKTAELIKGSLFVISHISTAKSYAILWKKPIVFITTDELNMSWIRPHIDFHALALKKSPVNINNQTEYPSKLQDLLAIDDDAYAEYQQNYLKIPGSPEKPLMNIFVDYLQEHCIEA